MTNNTYVDMKKLRKKEKDVAKSNAPLSMAASDDLLLIEDAIKDFKSDFLTIFEDHPDTTSLQLVTVDDKEIELTLFRDHLIYENHQKTGSDGKITMDFETNTIRANNRIIKNVDVLKKLFKRINRLIKGLDKGRVELYELE
jgi:hypothetical protein